MSSENLQKRKCLIISICALMLTTSTLHFAQRLNDEQTYQMVSRENYMFYGETVESRHLDCMEPDHCDIEAIESDILKRQGVLTNFKFQLLFSLVSAQKSNCFQHQKQFTQNTRTTSGVKSAANAENRGSKGIKTRPNKEKVGYSVSLSNTNIKRLNSCSTIARCNLSGWVKT